MELGFDKEIDAILRKARDNQRNSELPNGHLDADAISAFVENALPQRTKTLYIAHISDCDRCRKQLSQMISLNSEAVATVASDVVTATVAETVLPWYQRLFRTPNLAMAMGALVLVFGGTLAFLVVQNRDTSDASTISQVKELEAPISGPNAAPFEPEAFANSMPATNEVENKALASANTAANAAPITSNSTTSPANRQELSDGLAAGSPAKPAPITETSAGASTGDLKKSPPPAPKDKENSETYSMSDDADAAVGGGRSMAEEKRKTRDENSLRRDLPAPASKSGPVRSGPVQMQSNQVNSNVFDMSVTRKVGGKTFANRDGVWVDSAYKGQSTTSIRRGTGDFNALDSKVRNIANELGGTVIVVSNAKAYRIQ